MKELLYRLHRQKQPVRAVWERKKPKLKVEGPGIFIDGIHNNGEGSDLACLLQTPVQSIHE